MKWLFFFDFWPTEHSKLKCQAFNIFLCIFTIFYVFLKHNHGEFRWEKTHIFQTEYLINFCKIWHPVWYVFACVLPLHIDDNILHTLLCPNPLVILSCTWKKIYHTPQFPHHSYTYWYSVSPGSCCWSSQQGRKSSLRGTPSPAQTQKTCTVHRAWSAQPRWKADLPAQNGVRVWPGTVIDHYPSHPGVTIWPLEHSVQLELWAGGLVVWKAQIN